MTIADRETNTITVTPINPTLGAVVDGVDLARIDEATWHQIEQA